MSYCNPIPNLAGAVVVDVLRVQSPHEWKNQGLDGVLLTLADGRRFQLDLEGDCCSRSYFTDPTQFEELKGARIQSVEEREGGRTEDDGGYTVFKAHFLVFVTDRGHVTIDWRNESNGYYDGSVEWREVES